nr:MAG: hypothetical protein EDM05_24755 [Leptolyngbya sp. IPPAS B-1204]
MTVEPTFPTLSHRLSQYRPMLSPEHGVYIVLLVSFITGAAAAQTWTWQTTLALICAFLGFQAEHPFVLQIRQRKSLKPRFLIWGMIYGGTALGIAVYLALRSPTLLWLYSGALVALGVDSIAVWQREQKSILNEMVTFTAVCLAAPLAYGATTGTFSRLAIGLWLLNSLFFSATIFAVKWRKAKLSSVRPGAIYHAIASLIVFGLYGSGWLPWVTALAFGVALLKFGLICWQQQWYRKADIRAVAMLETCSALLFLSIVSLSVLPAIR